MAAMDKREKLIIMNRGLQVEAVPEIVSIFSRSKNVSLMKGRTYFLLRKKRNPGKRSLLDREMEEAEETKENITKLTSKIEELEEKINVHQRREDELLQDKEKLCKLYELGIIDNDGEYNENHE